MVKVAVIGAGIIGLSTAYNLKQTNPKTDITLISEKFSPDTTGDGSAGLWHPYLLQDTPPELIKKWSIATFEFFLKLWKSSKGGECGISLIPVTTVSSDNYIPPEGGFGLRELTQEELQRLSRSSKTLLQKGYSFTTFTCEPKKILPYFLREFTKAGGNVEQRRVTDLESLRRDYEIVVNCSGLEAHHLISDKSVLPIRGQLIKVNAPSIFYSLANMDDDGAYIIPNQDCISLGGTHQVNDWNTIPDKNDAECIKNKCYNMVPSLKHAPIIQNWVGLRPGRPFVRLELEKAPSKDGKAFTIIHNYGHGGSGVTLCWGCALDVEKLVRETCLEYEAFKMGSC